MKNPIALALIASALSSTAFAQNCVTTIYAGGNGGGVGWTIFFDATAATPLSLSALDINSSTAAGTPVTFEIYTSSGFAGNEADPSAWTLATIDDGTSVSAGAGMPTTVTFQTPFMIPAGTTGIAVFSPDAAFQYTNGNGMNQSYTDGTLTLDLGASIAGLFTGLLFTPRVMNGAVCYGGGGGNIGSNYCAAAANSTGATGVMSATGSTSAAADSLILTASDLPANQFGIFVTSMSQAFIPMAGGTSNGNLCLGGALGRFSQPSQILNTGTGGSFNLSVGTMMMPQGAGFVAVMPGESWNFQAWHRDPVGLGSNFTDGLEISFN